MAKTLKELSQEKKVVIIVVLMVIIAILIIRSFLGVYSGEKDKWSKRKTLEENKKIEITDRSLYDLDQVAAIKNKVNDVQSNLLAEIQKSKEMKEETDRTIAENQKIIAEQQEKYLALTNINEKEVKKDNNEITQEIRNLKENLDETKKELAKIKKEKEVKASLDSVNVDLPPLNGALADVVKKIDSKEANTEKLSDLPLPEVESKNSFFDFGNNQKNNDLTQTEAKDKTKNKKVEGEEDNAGPKMDLMMGLVDATLVMGVDAPTNIGTKNSDAKDPLPVLLTVSSEALIANNYRQDYKNCLILATATGNATTERAYLRLSQLSCVSKNGEKRIEADVEGWVVGEDNKTGVSGNLVTKSGTLILKGLMAGIAQGLAEAASNTNNYITTNGQYSSSTSASGSMAEGFGSGAGSAFKTLADFYIEMAKDLYPVIEVKGGRKVQILIKGSGSKKPLREVPYNKLFVNTDYELESNDKFKIEY